MKNHYDPTDEEVEALHATNRRAKELQTQIEERRAKRIKKRGRKAGDRVVCTDNPGGGKGYKAVAAGLAAAYADVAGNKSAALEAVASAIGIENNHRPNQKRGAQDGDRGRILRRWMQEAETSGDDKARSAYENARKGETLFSGGEGNSLSVLIDSAKATGLKSDVNDACEAILDLAQKYAVGRYLYVRKNKE